MTPASITHSCDFNREMKIGSSDASHLPGQRHEPHNRPEAYHRPVVGSLRSDWPEIVIGAYRKCGIIAGCSLSAADLGYQGLIPTRQTQIHQWRLNMTGRSFIAILITLLFSLLSLATIASATTIYVDGNLASDCLSGEYSIANRDASGSDGSAYNTVQKAIDVVNPGDVVIVRGGTYYPTDQTVFSRQGTSAAYIELKSYPGEVPVINGRDVPVGTLNHSTPIWGFKGTQYWKVTGPLTLTNGRGAGLSVDGASRLVISRIESSYNGQTAKTGGHGFFVWEGDDITFENCDAHHNTNHLWPNRGTPDDQIWNQYQHGDGWRISHSDSIRLIGCRAWNNLDDAYDFYMMDNPVQLTNCWAAYSGKDDDAGSITGIPNFVVPGDDVGSQYVSSRIWWGNGFKLGYGDTANHQVTGCVAWGNLLSGFHMNMGPSTVVNSIAFGNDESGFHFDTNGISHELRNTWAHGNGQPVRFYDFIAGAYTTSTLTNSSHNSWDASAGFTVTDADFANLIDDSVMLGPRQADGSLPVSDFLRLVSGSDLIDQGVDVGLAYNGLATDIGAFEYVDPTATATVVARRVYYNNSAFDGNNPTANEDDDEAIATDKQSLLPGGTATFANYTSYFRGINGVMVDITELAGTPTSSDFEINVGNDDAPGSWTAGPAPSVSVRAGAGAGGSSRVTLTWADGQIVNEWLEVRVLATGNTSLSSQDVFYFGSAIGETGNSLGHAQVTADDEVAVRNNPASITVNPAEITDTCDFNRDRKVSPTDAIISRNNGTNSTTALRLISFVPNQPPEVSAGGDATIALPTTSVSLDGTVNDDGKPASPGVVTTTWSMKSGPGTVTFADASAVDTTATFSSAGLYVLEFEAFDGELTSSDTAQVNVVDPVAQLLLADDFDDNDISDWSVIAGSGWAASGGKATKVANDSTLAAIAKGGFSVSSGIITLEFEITVPGAWRPGNAALVDADGNGIYLCSYVGDGEVEVDALNTTDNGLTGTGGTIEDFTADASAGVTFKYEVNLDTGEVKGYLNGTLENTTPLDLTGVGAITKVVFQAKKNWALDNVVLQKD